MGGMGGADAGSTGGAAGFGGSMGGSAGTGAGGAATGGMDGAASGCAGKTYKLCEDFESSTLGSVPASWTSIRGYNERSARLTKLSQAMHSTRGPRPSRASRPRKARVACRRHSPPSARRRTNTGDGSSTSAEPIRGRRCARSSHDLRQLDGGTIENRIVDTVESQGAHTHQWLFNTPDDSCCSSSAYSWTFDAAWHCAEWSVDVTTKSFRFFADSTEVTALAFANRTNAEMPTSYGAVILGATYYQTDVLTGPFTMWIDDLAIDDNRIGCQ